ncbi:MAG: flagellar biosynthetic protein FliQ [Aquabacterium sp.]|uniref:flagellar biosynthetic protein FliQ n=1 Tax=Aquabacterium sp. TaxID=1872578 RepID=UPI00271B429B|nr:flagellar biosynthetic protein FliQ [Aquabacterium sp.]MDO9005751.1 flagellar biosynthetic protein FliQ [Aquabacterium sp.]
MTAELALQLFSEMLKTGLLVCAPLLGLTLITGILVSVFQVVTQIQDATLAFIPKMIVFVIGALVLAPWMLRKLVAFAQAALAQAATLS